MARIRVLKIRGRSDKNKPKVVYFHNNNFDNYTTKRSGKYNVVTTGAKQKDKFLNNQMRAYSAKIRFHTKRA